MMHLRRIERLERAAAARPRQADHVFDRRAVLDKLSRALGGPGFSEAGLADLRAKANANGGNLMNAFCEAHNVSYAAIRSGLQARARA